MLAAVPIAHMAWIYNIQAVTAAIMVTVMPFDQGRVLDVVQGG